MQKQRNWRKHNIETGKKFGRLALTGRSNLRPMYGQLRRFVEADCECGVNGWYLYGKLYSGELKSCGCLQPDVARITKTTHGLSKHPLYLVYHEMLRRCYVPTNHGYKDYGGRGITVCDEWQENFVTFFEWAIEAGWEEGLSLDRKKNNNGYSPKNCRFATRGVQNRNTRRNKMITAFGETKCLFDWGKDPRCVVTVWALRSRLDRGKWADMEAMITTPQTPKLEIAGNTKSNRMLTAFGETKCLNAWLRDERCTVKVDSLRDRLDKRWDHEKAISFPARRV